MKKMKSAAVAAIILAITLVISACGIGGRQSAQPEKEETPAGKYSLFAIEIEECMIGNEEIGMTSDITLDEDGTGYMTINDDGGDIESWAVTGESITIHSGLSIIDGKLKDGIMALEMDYGMEYYAKEGVDISGYQLKTMDEFIACGARAKFLVKEGIKSLYGIGGEAYGPETARSYFMAAADEGNGDAWYYLGKLYENSGEEGRYEKAMTCFQNALDNDSYLGLYGIARLYERGEGVEADYAKAEKYYKQAAEMGLKEANNGLAHLYHFGRGVEKDGLQAITYYKEALKGTEFGIVNSAKTDIGRIYYYGTGGVTQDQEKGLQWIQEAADAGYDNAYYYMGFIYSDGEVVEQDNAKAMEYFQKGADLENISCMYQVAVNYLKGTGVERDLTKALEWFEKSADKGDSSAMVYLGVLYSNEVYSDGELELDYAKAREYYTRAIAEGDEWGYYNMGLMYYAGRGGDVDYASALPLFQKGAELGQGGSMRFLGTMYQNGYGVEANKEEAIKWYKAALETDDLSQDEIDYINEQLTKLGA